MFLAILAILIYILPYTISSILDSINASNGVKIGSIIFTSLLSIGQFFASYTKIFPNIKTIGPVILRWLLYYTFLFVSSVLINYISVFFLLVGPLVLIMIYNLYKLYKCNPNNLTECTSGLLLPFSNKSVSWDKLISPIYTEPFLRKQQDIASATPSKLFKKINNLKEIVNLRKKNPTKS